MRVLSAKDDEERVMPYTTDEQVKAVAMILGPVLATLERLSPGWRTAFESELAASEQLFRSHGKNPHADHALNSIECAREIIAAALSRR